MLAVNQEARVDFDLGVTGHAEVDVDATTNLKMDRRLYRDRYRPESDQRSSTRRTQFLRTDIVGPRAVPATPGSAGSVRGDFSFSVNGAREDANNFLLDGVYNIDPKLNIVQFRPSVDAIREFDVDQHL